MDIGGDELLGGLVLHGHDRTQELEHLDGMRALTIVEINTVLDLTNVGGIFVCVMLEDQLLQVQEGTLMLHFLTHLYNRLPGVLGSHTRTLVTLLVGHHILNFEYLLQDRIGKDLVGKKKEERRKKGKKRKDEAL